MNQNPIAEAVCRLATPVVESLGLVIWGVEVAQSGRMVVRLFVDVPSDGRNPHAVAEELAAMSPDADSDEAGSGLPSASIDQCEEISRHLGLALEVEDPIAQAYVLEVSTPGFNRLFFSPEQMRPYVGDMVEARMQAAYAPRADMAPRRTWRGRLEAVEPDGFVLTPAGVTPEGQVLPEAVEPVRLPWDMTRRVARVHVFRAPEKPGRPGGGARRKGRQQARPASPAAADERGAARQPHKNDALDDDVASALKG